MARIAAIVRENATAEEVAVAKRCAPTQQGFVRFQALELLLQGYSQGEVARISDRDERTVQRWLAAFNERGIDGLALKGRAGRPRKIDAQRFGAEYVPLVLEPERAGETHWTALKFHGYLKEQYREELSYSTLIRYLHENKLELRYPRRWPERQNEQERQEYLRKHEQLCNDACISLWYCDEAGFEGDPRPRRRWVKVGSRPRVPYLGDHIRYHAIGAVSPRRGELFSLVVPHSDHLVFQTFLNELAKYTSQREPHKRIVLILDNASWHKHASLNWHDITPCYLPAYSPDYNPIEAIWRVLKERFFNGWIAKTPEALIERLCDAIRSLLAGEISSISSVQHLLH